MGVARIALAARAPVVPVAMIGTERIQPPGTVVPTMGELRRLSGQEYVDAYSPGPHRRSAPG
jgi:1-acyl-sn-glycerol-3-phosphate acyltransferase